MDKKEELQEVFATVSNTINLLGGQQSIVNKIRGQNNEDFGELISSLKSYNMELLDLVKDRLYYCT